jgi:hypothetical protein
MPIEIAPISVSADIMDFVRFIILAPFLLPTT